MNNKIRSYQNTGRKPIIIGLIDIEINASQEQIGIERVEFYIDDILQATDITVPYSWTWNNIRFFKHTIKVIAYDTSGKSTSTSIGVWKFF